LPKGKAETGRAVRKALERTGNPLFYVDSPRLVEV
jgi:hypothetical protein